LTAAPSTYKHIIVYYDPVMFSSYTRPSVFCSDQQVYVRQWRLLATASERIVTRARDRPTAAKTNVLQVCALNKAQSIVSTGSAIERKTPTNTHTRTRTHTHACFTQIHEYTHALALQTPFKCQLGGNDTASQKILATRRRLV